MFMKFYSVLFLINCVNCTFAVRCKASYYNSGILTSHKHGYCWKVFVVTDLPDRAAAVCERTNGRLLAINTATKARKLTQYLTDNAYLFESGRMGKQFKKWPISKNVVISPIHNGRWATTNQKVTFKGAQVNKATVPRECALFNFALGLWHYAHCSGKGVIMCEEIGHLYPNEEDPDEATTATARRSARAGLAKADDDNEDDDEEEEEDSDD